MKESVRLGRIAGIAVGFNWSLLLIAALLAFTLGGDRFPTDAPGYSQTAYSLAGLFTAVAFLGGVLAHEISHALVARRDGLGVDGIVLWLMGGYTRITEQPKTPASELRISAAGPATSLLVGISCAVLAGFGHAFGIPALAVSVLTWLGTINILLAVFNMLPGAPLDGGRIVHAAYWWRSGDRHRAARVASKAGSVLGTAMIALGVLAIFNGRVGIDGLWLAVVGAFLLSASRAEGAASEFLEALDGLNVTQVMATPGVGPGWLTVDAFLREYAGGPLRPPAFLVEQWGGGLAGLAPTAPMERIPYLQRGSLRVVQFAIPMASLPVLGPTATATEAATTMSERRAPWALVVAGGNIVGVLSLEDMPAAGRRAQAPAAVDSPPWSLTRG